MKPKLPLHTYVEQTFDAIDRAMQVAVDQAVSDELLGWLARAHVGATRAELVMHAIDVPHDQERIYADEVRRELPANGELPPLRKQPKHNAEGYLQRPGIGKKLRKPIEFACFTCGAQPDEACFQMSSQGKHGVPLPEPKKAGTYHQARYTLSKQANTKLRREYDRQHFGGE